VGGSGLYIRSLIDGLFEGPQADKEYREFLERRVREGEAAQLLDELKEIDPITAAKSDPTKPRRIIRALEVYHITGQPMSALQLEQKINIDFIPCIFGLEWNRKALYHCIERRCEEMVASGLLDEVERLEKKGYTTRLNALNTVGYAEAFAYRKGEISYNEMMRLFKQNTRRYAKRQLTWFRRDARIRWIQMDEGRETAEVAKEIAQIFSRERDL
jgi:tRNA dimethylallyltransferase